MTSEHNAPLAALRDAPLLALRASLAAQNLDGFIIPRADEHLGEYVPEAAERLAYISGFTGSAGLAVVLTNRAAIWSDGRYTLQLAQQTDPAAWERLDSTETPPWDWLNKHAAGLRIGYDPWLLAADTLSKLPAVTLVAVAHNPVDAIWQNRPAPPAAPAIPHDIAYAGEDCATKRARIGKILADANQHATILTDPASLAWLFNLRGADVEFTPIALGYALAFADGTATLFMAPEKLPPETRQHLGNQVAVATRAQMPAALAALAGKTVRYDPKAQPAWFETTLKTAGVTIAAAPDPVELPRAIKNPAEQAGARAAHLRDGLAMVRFLAWLATAAPTGAETEISAAAYLLAQRARGKNFRGESFPAISGAGEHGAIIHYRATPESNRLIHPNEVYLIDSGGQYLDATTDITRTLWTGPNPAPEAIKDHATRVLAGHIALAQAVFPANATGTRIDTLARAALWQAGLDYDHGTGHGVGAYLSVHEGPASISPRGATAFEPGMILSNEPGYYLPGQYGIRLENLLLVHAADFAPQKQKFLRFETLTLAPFDRALIEPERLSPEAIKWLNNYHASVREKLSPLLQDESHTLEWLNVATAKI